jgi:hypothetical protein
MTDFGGAGHGGIVAECELNLPEQSVAGCSTLTSSDLNELGCTSSTSAKSTASSSGISSAKSDRSKGGSTGAGRRGSNGHNSVRSGSLLSLFRKSRSTTPSAAKGPLANQRSRSTHTASSSQSQSAAQRPSRRARSSSRIFVQILRAFTGGFANCSKKRNNEDTHSRRGSNSCSNSDAISNNLDLLNQYPNSQGRRKSHDGSHDGTNGSDSTSTGYVSDSSNEKHYPKSGKKPAVTVSTISQAVDDAKAAELATAWSEAIKTAATIRRPAPKSDSSTPDPPDDSSAHAPTAEPAAENVDEMVQTASSSNRDSTASERAYSYENITREHNFCYVASSASEEEVTTDSLYTTGTESGSSDYETNETSSYEEETDEKEIKATKRNGLLDMIKEEDEEESHVARKAVKRRKSTLKRKRTLKGQDSLKGQDDLKSGMKSTLASLKAKEEDNVSRTGSLKDMILQFETAVAALEINENRIEENTNKENETKSPLQGVKAIAQKIQEQTRLESTEAEVMPPSQILKLKQALELEPEANLNQPIPLSRRSESKVAQIARQLAEAERQRVQMEKAMAKNGGKSPKATKKQSSTSFINELLEMARAESVDKLNEESSNHDAPDFKQSLLAARKKITQREDELANQNAQNAHTAPPTQSATPASAPVPLLVLKPTVSASSMGSEGSEINSQSGPNVNEEIDPFVKEVLRSKTVPEPVKQKIRIECWSLFNDPRTPKGVKQCILATMLSKVQNE